MPCSSCQNQRLQVLEESWSQGEFDPGSSVGWRSRSCGFTVVVGGSVQLAISSGISGAPWFLIWCAGVFYLVQTQLFGCRNPVLSNLNPHLSASARVTPSTSEFKMVAFMSVGAGCSILLRPGYKLVRQVIMDWLTAHCICTHPTPLFVSHSQCSITECFGLKRVNKPVAEAQVPESSLMLVSLGDQIKSLKNCQTILETCSKRIHRCIKLEHLFVAPLPSERGDRSLGRWLLHLTQNMVRFLFVWLSEASKHYIR